MLGLQILFSTIKSIYYYYYFITFLNPNCSSTETLLLQNTLDYQVFVSFISGSSSMFGTLWQRTVK